MSREIKFRGWDKYDKKMIYDLCQVDSFWHYYSYSDNTGLHFGKTGPNGVGEDFENKYIMQYTGLKDKNGKEIYEGDIVKFENKHLMKVIFDTEENPSFMVEDDERLLFMKKGIPYEVIGNIYENPELLEVE